MLNVYAQRCLYIAVQLKLANIRLKDFLILPMACRKLALPVCQSYNRGSWTQTADLISLSMLYVSFYFCL